MKVAADSTATGDPEAHARDPRVSRFVIIAHGFVLALVFLLVLVYLFSGRRAEDAVRPACLLLALVVAWSLWSWWRITGSLFDPYGLFVIAATLFNGGQALLEIFGLNEQGILRGRFPAEVLLQALFLVIISMGMLHLGALLGAATVRRRAAGVADDGRWPTERDLRDVGWGLLAISVIPATIEAKRAVSVVMASGYFALFWPGAPTGLEKWPQVLGTFLVPGALFLLAGSRERPAARAVSTAAVIIYAAFQFFVGSRAGATMALIAYVWLWHHRIRRLPLGALLAAAAIMVFVVFPLVSLVRGVPGARRSSGAFVREAFTTIDNPGVAAFSEMGGTLRVVAYTIQFVPRAHNYEAGLGYLNALFTIIPSFFWETHPGRSSAWLVKMVDPVAAARGRGLGGSFIAQAYVNFGWVGGPLLLAVIGYCLASLVRWAQHSSHPANLALMASFTAFFVIYARAEASSVLRMVVWYSVLPYTAAWMTVGLRRADRWKRMAQPSS